MLLFAAASGWDEQHQADIMLLFAAARGWLYIESC